MPPETPSPEQAPREMLERMLHTLTMLVYNTDRSLWMSNYDRDQAIKRCSSVLVEIVGISGDMRITAKDDEIMINGVAIQCNRNYTLAFIEQLEENGLTTLFFRTGLTQDEIVKFLELFNESVDDLEAAGGLHNALRAVGVEHIDARKVVLREVAEDERVISSAALAGDAEALRRKAETDVLAGLTASGEGDHAALDAGIRQVADDSHRMAGLILDAATQRAGEGDEQARGAAIRDCLRMTFDSLRHDPDKKTQKGRADIRKKLEQLEKELVTRLETDAPPEAVESICQTLGDMTEQVKVESIAAEYARKIKALEKSEKRILRFIKVMGMEHVEKTDLQTQLDEGGLDVEGWHALLAKSGAAKIDQTDGDPSLEADAAAVQTLATLIDRLASDIKTTAAAPDAAAAGADRLTTDLKETTRQVDGLLDKTGRKIEQLVNAVNADLEVVTAQEQLAAKTGKGPMLSRKRLLEILAEIVQELAQPLSVIRCSIDMVVSNALGEVPDPQREMLVLVDEGTERLQTLVGSLVQIAGMPKTVHPDQAILGQAYGESGLDPKADT